MTVVSTRQREGSLLLLLLLLLLAELSARQAQALSVPNKPPRVLLTLPGMGLGEPRLVCMASHAGNCMQQGNGNERQEVMCCRTAELVAVGHVISIFQSHPSMHKEPVMAIHNVCLGTHQSRRHRCRRLRHHLHRQIR